MRVTVIGLLIAINTVSATAHAHLNTISLAPYTPSAVTVETCGKNSTGLINFSYCVFPSSDINNKDLLIHFHGLHGGATTWKTNAQYEQLRREVAGLGKSLPTVITVSLGKLWLLTEVAAKNNRYASVMNSIVPFLENMAGFTGEGRRMLIGESMGGFNAMQVYLRNPNTFAKVAILCPVAADLSPWSTEREITDYIRRTGAQSIRVAFFMDVAADEFPTPLDWDLHNPLLLASRLKSSTSSVYLSADERDEFGFYEGAEILNGFFTKALNNYKWDPLMGVGHCQINPKSIARFLTSL
jgi:S-formylglutathione hydrolase FrmB